MSWWKRLLGTDWDGSSGRPRSGNGASSFHLFWEVPSHSWIAAAASIEVLDPPTDPELYFWALQVSFVDRGRRGGGAHLGLQWHAPHPGGTAVNWGGYGPQGSELRGSESSLPSATGNVNTRDYPWQPGRRYRLSVERLPAVAPDGSAAWRGAVTDLDGDATTTTVRDLWCDGDAGRYLDSPMVWSEVFADCDAPSTTVRWSDLQLTDEQGSVFDVDAVRVNYQSVSDGGCTTTNSDRTGNGFVQQTAAERTVRQGAVLRRGRG